MKNFTSVDKFGLRKIHINKYELIHNIQIYFVMNTIITILNLKYKLINIFIFMYKI